MREDARHDTVQIRRPEDDHREGESAQTVFEWPPKARELHDVFFFKQQDQGTGNGRDRCSAQGPWATTQFFSMAQMDPPGCDADHEGGEVGKGKRKQQIVGFGGVAPVEAGVEQEGEKQHCHDLKTHREAHDPARR